ncbi:DUF1054 domain-containing protein [Bacillus sp. DNRA2]|uniref:YktB family protein n=1 Tax=Bacillus sp. DNRA2 TaxID=2723053 RepID=UPI00145EF381|nr:DUF1054 domain-containing protein [Bacillus sp. DNRA2]NMD71937.1 DUF1054 domain-containing protein [Bacillus sp. DNRA2]
MSSFSGFTNEDFDLFKIEGLEQRMEVLIQTVRPKLEWLGNHFAPSLATLTGQEMFPHVAKHARRTKNPPNDTWVAFANNSRGYKMLPHFQIGLWESHLFIWFAVIYECPLKEGIGEKLINQLDSIQTIIPKDFVWSMDHTQPEASPHHQLNSDQLLMMFERLHKVKKAEILCGYQIPRSNAVKMSPEALLKQFEFVFEKLIPLYKLSSF